MNILKLDNDILNTSRRRICLRLFWRWSVFHKFFLISEHVLLDDYYPCKTLYDWFELHLTKLSQVILHSVEKSWKFIVFGLDNRRLKEKERGASCLCWMLNAIDRWTARGSARARCVLFYLSTALRARFLAGRFLINNFWYLLFFSSF